MRRLPFFETAPALEIEDGEGLEPSPTCTRCKLGQTARTVCMAPAAIRPTAPGPVLLVLGDRPGYQEDVSGKPWSGASGSFVRPIIDRRWPGPVVFSNAINCYPAKGKVTPATVRECRPYLRQLELDLQPARILAFGAMAAQALVSISIPPASTRRGYTHMSDGRPVFFLMHPTDTYRNGFMRRWLEEDLEWALTAQPPRAPWDGAALLIENANDARAAAEALREACVFDAATLSIDTEWYGCMGDTDFRPLTLGLSVGGDAYVWDEGYLGPLKDSQAIGPVLDLMEDETIPKSAHAAKADWRAAWHGFGVRVRGLDACTRLHRKFDQADASAYLEDMQALIGRPGWKRAGGDSSDAACSAITKEIAARAAQRTACDLLCGDLTPKQVEKVEAGLKRSANASEKARADWRGSDADFERAIMRVESTQGNDAGRDPKSYMFGGVDHEVRAKYCAMDTVSQHALLQWLRPRVETDPGLARVWREVQRPFHRAVEAMETNGLLIDMAAARHLSSRLGKQIESLNKYLLTTGGPEFNVNASAQVAKLLQSMGAPLGRPGKSGVPSVDAKVLKKLVLGITKTGAPKPYAAFAKAVLLHRHATKFKANYPDAMAFALRDDERVHPNIKIDGTETGRPSSETPNVLVFPRPDAPSDQSDRDAVARYEDAKACRDLIIAPPGWTMLEMDQRQVEFVMAGILAGDEVLLGQFESGIDFHLATARLIAPIFGIDPAEVGKKHWLRSAAKTINFAVLYGDPVESTAAKLGIPVDQAAKIRAAILGKFKKLAAWIETRLKEGRRTGVSRTYWRGEPALRRPLWKIANVGDEGKAKEERETAERGTWNGPVQGSAALITNATCGVYQAWIDETGSQDHQLILTVYDSILTLIRDAKVLETAHMLRGMATQWHPLLRVDLKVGRSWGSMEELEID